VGEEGGEEEEDEDEDKRPRRKRRTRETKPTAENSDIVLARPRLEPPTALAPVDPFQETRDRVHGPGRLGAGVGAGDEVGCRPGSTRPAARGKERQL